MLRILSRILLAIVLLLSLGLFTIGGLYWFGLRDASYNPPIPLNVDNILASYPCRADPDAWRWDQTRVRLKNIEVDLTRAVRAPQDETWNYVPVQGTNDKLWVEYWRTDVPPAGPFTLIGYQLHTPPTSAPVPPSLAAQSEQGQLYVVSYDNRNYYEFQHNEAIGFFVAAGFLLVLVAIAVGLYYATSPVRRWMKSQRAAVARLVGEPTSPVEIAEAQARHARLLETLRDCGIDRAPTSRGLRWVLSAVVVFAIGIATLIGRNAMDAALTTADNQARVVITVLWVAFATFVLARVRNRALRSAWQSSARSAEKELERSSSRRPILYLRSFQLDDQIGKPTWMERLVGTIPLQTAEQKVTKVLRKYGPVIAIGRPAERLPSLGAARFYVSHELWQTKVAEIARESRFVVWATGGTEGLIWEISHLIENVPPENIIIWAHPHLLRLDAQGREAEWTKFLQKLGHLFPKPLPEKLGEARFFYFTPNWEPHAVAPPRRPWTWFGMDASALRALLGVKQGTLSEAKATYPGWKAEDEFVSLIGARTNPIQWPRPVAYLIASVFGQFPYLFLNPSDFFISNVPQTLVFAAATVAAFRFLPSTIAPAAAAVVPALCVAIGFAYGGILQTFLSALAFLIGLVWATRRIRPLVVALWMGAMCGWVTGEFIRYFTFGGFARYDSHAFWLLLLRPVLFAVCLAITIRFLPELEKFAVRKNAGETR
jgi:hypothetical protein